MINLDEINDLLEEDAAKMILEGFSKNVPGLRKILKSAQLNLPINRKSPHEPIRVDLTGINPPVNSNWLEARIKAGEILRAGNTITINPVTFINYLQAKNTPDLGDTNPQSHAIDAVLSAMTLQDLRKIVDLAKLYQDDASALPKAIIEYSECYEAFEPARAELDEELRARIQATRDQVTYATGGQTAAPAATIDREREISNLAVQKFEPMLEKFIAYPPYAKKGIQASRFPNPMKSLLAGYNKQKSEQEIFVPGPYNDAREAYKLELAKMLLAHPVIMLNIIISDDLTSSSLQDFIEKIHDQNPTGQEILLTNLGRLCDTLKTLETASDELLASVGNGLEEKFKTQLEDRHEFIVSQKEEREASLEAQINNNQNFPLGSVLLDLDQNAQFLACLQHLTFWRKW